MDAIGALLRLRFLGLLGLMMADSRTSRRTGHRMSAADLVTGDCTDRGAFGSAGGLLVAVAVGVRADRETHENGSQYDPSHRNLPLMWENQRALMVDVAMVVMTDECCCRFIPDVTSRLRLWN
jgi:hypothetical protein